MSVIYAGQKRVGDEHFHPEADADPATQRRLRGALEQIDYTAYASSREVVGRALPRLDQAAFAGLALACAQARAAWVAEAFQMSRGRTGAPQAASVQRLAELRVAFEELSQAYEGARRMVERGYLTYEPAPTR